MDLVAYGQYPDQSFLDFIEDPMASDSQFPGRKWIRSYLLAPFVLYVRICLQEFSNSVENDSLLPDREGVQILVRAWDEFDFEFHNPKLPLRRRVGKSKNGSTKAIARGLSCYFRQVGEGGEEVVRGLGLGFGFNSLAV